MLDTALAKEPRTKRFARLLMQIMVGSETVQFLDEFQEQNAEALFVVDTPPLPIAILMFVSPTYWVPEAYSRGHWSLKKGDLAEFILFGSENASGGYRRYLKYVQKRMTLSHLLKQKVFHKFFTRKVKSHYELDPDFYAQILDPEMVYTCAFYETATTLESAQQEKFRIIAERLNIRNDGSNLLNIGCGWGSFERFIAKTYSHVRITGLSISPRQVAWTKAHNANTLSQTENDRITLVEEDYIDHVSNVRYDAVTAVGMVEHVGQSGYREFFAKSYELLKPKCKLLVHMIVKSKSDTPTNRWIDRFIFPGGYAPSISELTKGAEDQNFRVENIHIHRPENYKRTLLDWRSNLTTNRHKILNLYKHRYRYDDETSEYLFRQWEIFLAGSEASFSLKQHPLQIAQFVFEKYTRK